MYIEIIKFVAGLQLSHKMSKNLQLYKNHTKQYKVIVNRRNSIEHILFLASQIVHSFTNYHENTVKYCLAKHLTNRKTTLQIKSLVFGFCYQIGTQRTSKQYLFLHNFTKRSTNSNVHVFRFDVLIFNLLGNSKMFQ